jgi:hypothetical protein
MHVVKTLAGMMVFLKALFVVFFFLLDLLNVAFKGKEVELESVDSNGVEGHQPLPFIPDWSPMDRRQLGRGWRHSF